MFRKNAYKSMHLGHGPRLKVRMSELSKVIYGQKSVEELTGNSWFFVYLMYVFYISAAVNVDE